MLPAPFSQNLIRTLCTLPSYEPRFGGLLLLFHRGHCYACEQFKAKNVMLRASGHKNG